MKLAELDQYFRTLLDIDSYSGADDSLNGLQVGRKEGEAGTVAFAVDACMESFRRAAEGGADLLFVHHGIFWGKPAPLTGVAYERVSFLMGKGLSLYACHLPLDAHPELGNNAGLASLLGLGELKPFGLHRGKAVGYSGVLEKPLRLEEAIARVLPDGSVPRAVYPFGPAELKTAACVSGGGFREAQQALDAGLDLFVTGDSYHELYHQAMEGGMSIISAGHYRSETWGVKALSERLSRDTGLKSFFIDLPTGL